LKKALTAVLASIVMAGCQTITPTSTPTSTYTPTTIIVSTSTPAPKVETLDNKLMGFKLITAKRGNDEVMLISLAYDTDNSGEPDLFKLYKISYTPQGGWFYIRQLVAEEKNEYGMDYGLFSMSSRNDFQ